MNALRFSLFGLLAVLLAPGVALAQDVIVPAPIVEPPPLVQLPLPGQALTPPTTLPAHERNCVDHQDEDADGLPDCADADCFDAEACHAGGSEERTNAACSDWIDNDGDVAVDCDDQDCQTQLVTVCNGSWTGGGETGGGAEDLDVPELQPGQSLEDLVGEGGDVAGERSDEACSDGLDNDLDGRIDCADVSCRFSPMVAVCGGQPGPRLSIGAAVGIYSQWNLNQPVAGGPTTETNESNAQFDVLQLRALGPIPFIQNSFFLLSFRAEDSLRLVFALFQLPLSSLGHYIQLNSGSGGLSTVLVISSLYRPFVDPPFYFGNRFEQGNGASIEVGGPIDDRGLFRFRAFGAGGSGQFNGSVGGGFFRSDERNFSWTLGGQVQLNALGQYNRLYDNYFVYTPDPGTIAVLLGAKYDQRAAERMVVSHAQLVFQYWHFMLRAEMYTGFVMDDPSTIPIQTSWNVVLGALIVPRLLETTFDVGGYQQPVAYSFGPPNDPNYRAQREEIQFRAAVHVYVFRSTAWLTAMYRGSWWQTPDDRARRNEIEHQIRLEARFRY